MGLESILFADSFGSLRAHIAEVRRSAWAGGSGRYHRVKVSMGLLLKVQRSSGRGPTEGKDFSRKPFMLKKELEESREFEI